MRLGLGVDTLVGVLVKDLGLDSGCNASVQAAASLTSRAKTRGTLIKPHPDSFVGVVATLNDNLSALTDSKSDHVSLVRLDGDKVVGDDSHIVAINAEEEDSLSTVVDQTEQVLLASFELESGKVVIRGASSFGLVAGVAGLAVDEHVVGGRREDRSFPGGVVDLLEEVLVVIVEPIAKHYRADIDIPLVSRRTVNDYGTRQAVEVLRRVVSVPPSGSKEFSANTVSERGTRSDRAVADSRNTIVPRGSRLQETMPVNRSAFVLKFVLDGDLDPITPVRLNERARELVVDHEHRSYNTIWLHCGVRDSPVVLACDACVRDLAWVVRVGVVCAPVSPWPNTSAWLRAIEVTIKGGAVERSKRTVA